jgi:hypothetical protein
MRGDLAGRIGRQHLTANLAHNPDAEKSLGLHYSRRETPGP